MMTSRSVRTRARKSRLSILPHHLHHFVLNLREQQKDLKESSIALLLSVLTGILAGVYLGHSKETLLMLPGLIVLVPGAMGVRGAIGAALGSRLSTALHLGTVKNFTLENRVVRANVFATFTMSVLVFVFLAVLAKALTVFLGIPGMSLSSFILIAVIGGTVAGVMLIFITFGTAIAAYKNGWDLDNIHAPLITALADFFTIPSLLFAAFIVTKAQPYADMLAAVIFLGTGLLILHLFLERGQAAPPESYRSIVIQSALVLAMTGTIDALAGIVLESRIQHLATVPILLVLIPVFLEEGGNIGNTLASRMATKLHLGTIASRFSLTGEVRKEFVLSVFLSIVIFPVTGLLTYALSMLFGIPLIPLGTLMLITTAAGYALHLIIVAVTFVVSIFSFRFNLDPDNTTIPIVTAIVDVLGVLMLLAAVSLFA